MDFGRESSSTCFSRIHLRTAAHDVRLRLNCEYPLVWTLESWRTEGTSRAVATRAAGGADPRHKYPSTAKAARTAQPAPTKPILLRARRSHGEGEGPRWGP